MTFTIPPAPVVIARRTTDTGTRGQGDTVNVPCLHTGFLVDFGKPCCNNRVTVKHK